MAKQYEVALSEIMYELAEQEKKKMPGWIAPTATAAGVVGGTLLGRKYLPQARDAMMKGIGGVEGWTKEAIKATPGAAESAAASEGIRKGVTDTADRIKRTWGSAEEKLAPSVWGHTGAGLMGGAALGIPAYGAQAIINRKKKEERR